jgi:serine/threonine protein kinase
MGATMQPGDLLDNKYAVERIIGKGGTGYVIAAQHLRLQRRVALKFLRPEFANQPDLCRRFLREARAAARLTGNHVARILDADTLSTGQPYLVMEYLEGEDMAALLRRRGRLPISEAVGYVLQACQAVSEAHALRIVHRDIKPANLFLTTGPGEPLVKVLDFGLSKVIDGDGIADDVTDADHVMGSPHFMSPEQIRTPGAVDERTDVWSLGATLFTLLTGRVPFAGRSLMEVCAALLCGPAPRIDPAEADVPADLESVVLRCLRIDAAERHASVAALACELAHFADPAALDPVEPGTGAHRGVELPRAASPSTAPVESSPAVSSRTRRVARIAARASWVVGALVAAGLFAWGARMVGAARTPPARVASASILVASPVARPASPAASASGERIDGTEHDASIRGDAPRESAAIPVSARGPGASRPKTAPSPASSPPSCAQPFYIDPRGIKAFRTECL